MCGVLNRGILPAGYSALIEGQKVDYVSVLETDTDVYARKANRVAVRYKDRRLVAVIEVVSPGNKTP